MSPLLGPTTVAGRPPHVVKAFTPSAPRRAVSAACPRDSFSREQSYVTSSAISHLNYRVDERNYRVDERHDSVLLTLRVSGPTLSLRARVLKNSFSSFS